MANSQAGKRGRSRSRDRLNLIALGVVLGGMSVPFVSQTPVQFVKDAQNMLAGSGATLSAIVPANPYNTLAQQLADKEQELNDREAMLAEREANDIGPSAGGIFGVLSFVFSLILLALIGVNFYLDSRRNKKQPLSSKFSVDLR
jgi:hypothetical protein